MLQNNDLRPYFLLFSKLLLDSYQNICSVFSMYIRKNKNPSGNIYYQLVESYREGKKVRQRILLSLGKQGEGKLDNLAEAVSRYTKLMTVEQLAKKLSVQDTYILGPLVILEKLFERLNLNSALKKISDKHEKISFDFRKIIFTLVVSRFVEPGSKLKVFEHWQNRFYPEMLEPDLKLHTFYRALDLLAQHKEDIEKNCYWHDKSLLNQKTEVILYDLTTLRFESVRTDLGKLRQFGYSKEKRSDCTQVILGLIVDKQGLPLGFELYPGNTFEGRSLSDIIYKMKRKFKARRFIFVGDRGLFSDKNIKELRKNQGEFIVGMKLGVFKKRHEEFYDKSRFTSLSEDLSVYETEHEGERLLITWSREREERDRRTREDILLKIKKKLSCGKVRVSHFVTNRNYKKYVMGQDKESPVLNEKAIEEEARRDGFFGVLTSVRSMSAKEILLQYKDLWKVEEAFREIKGTLRARPVFHWTDKRILGHLVMCFISYFCEAYLREVLRGSGVVLKSSAIDNKTIRPRPLTVVEAMRELKEVRAIPVKVKDQVLWTRTEIKGNAFKIFKAIGLGMPCRLLKICR